MPRKSRQEKIACPNPSCSVWCEPIRAMGWHLNNSVECFEVYLALEESAILGDNNAPASHDTSATARFFATIASKQSDSNSNSVDDTGSVDGGPDNWDVKNADDDDFSEDDNWDVDNAHDDNFSDSEDGICDRFSFFPTLDPTEEDDMVLSKDDNSASCSVPSTAEHGLLDHDYLTSKFTEHVKRDIEQHPVAPDLKSKIELLHMLKQARCPKYLYQEIMNWVKIADSRGVCWSQSQSTTSESVYKELTERYGLEDSVPVTTPLFLPACGVTVNITTHNFLDQLYSMLTDPILMRDENLLFTGDEPFAIPVPNRELIDVIDGSIYRQAHNVHVRLGGKDLLVPIILYIDKTHVDTHGRLCLEPVTFTLGIFKKEVRKHAFAWRPLGYIANQNSLPTVNSAGKAADYHLMLKFILGSVVAAQEFAVGIDWSFLYHDKRYDVKMKFPLLLQQPVIFSSSQR